MYRAASRFFVIPLGLGLSLGLHTLPHIGSRGSVPLAGPAPYSFPAGTVRLYRTGADSRTLRPLNLHTLADLSAPVIRTGVQPVPNEYPSIVAAADGSRLAVVENIHPNRRTIHSQDLTLQIFDARTGRSISSAHHPAVPVSLSGISADGRVVYGYSTATNGDTQCPNASFYLLAAGTGRVVRRLQMAAAPWDPALVGPNHQRLYTMTAPDHMSYCGPSWSYAPTISVYDLGTGKRLRTVRLTGVLGGRWETGGMINGEPIGGNWSPGFALSPDGSQLAVLDEHKGMLTLLRTPSLKVVTQEKLSQPVSRFDVLSALFGHVDTAEAKGQWTGAMIQTQYTADGHSLVETGVLLHPDAHHHYAASRSLGIRLIDIAHGHIRAWLNDGKPVLSVWPAPDGREVYSAVQGWSRKGGWLTTLRYHDPSSLRVRASRTLQHMGNWPLNLLFLQGPKRLR